jgi:hypothetical protein
MSEVNYEEFEKKQNSTREPRSQDLRVPSTDSFCLPDIMSRRFEVKWYFALNQIQLANKNLT